MKLSQRQADVLRAIGSGELRRNRVDGSWSMVPYGHVDGTVMSLIEWELIEDPPTRDLYANPTPAGRAWLDANPSRQPDEQEQPRDPNAPAPDAPARG